MRQVFVFLLFCLFIGNAIGEEHAHHHNENALTLNQGKKWSVDQIMNTNMMTIHSEFTKLELLISTKKVKQSDYAQLAKVISDSAQKIVANCKMEEKADQAFHVVLGELLAVADDLNNIKKRSHTIEKLKRTLKTYSEYFDQTFFK